jgi:hypothetical protein
MTIARVDSSTEYPRLPQFGAHPLVALVDPCGVAVDAGGVVGRPHRVDGGGAIRRAKIAVKQCVVVDSTLRVAREHGRRYAVQPLECGAGGTAGVLLP